jgi:hypothetical protein
MPGHETCSAPLSVCSSWGERVVHVCHGPDHCRAAWQLPRLCDSLGEAFEAFISGGRLRGWSVVDRVRGSHDYRVSRGGSPDQHWVRACLGSSPRGRAVPHGGVTYGGPCTGETKASPSSTEERLSTSDASPPWRRDLWWPLHRWQRRRVHRPPGSLCRRTVVRQRFAILHPTKCNTNTTTSFRRRERGNVH